MLHPIIGLSDAGIIREKKGQCVEVARSAEKCEGGRAHTVSL